MTSLFGKSKKKRKVANDISDNNNNIITSHDDEEEEPRQIIPKTKQQNSKRSTAFVDSFQDLGLDDTLVARCRSMGFKKPTRVQQTIIPFLLDNVDQHVLCLSATGSGKTAAFCLPILQHLSHDPYGIFATILTPTRELAKQIHQQIMALGGGSQIQSVLVVGGLDLVAQSCRLQHDCPHFVVATPGRLAAILRGPPPHPRLSNLRYIVLDEADRLLSAGSGFEDDVSLILQHTQQRQRRKNICQTLLFSATMTQSLETMEELAAGGEGRLPLQKFVIATKKPQNERGSIETTSESEEKEDGCSKSKDDSYKLSAPTLPAGLKQEYIFMPSRVRDAYLVTIIRNLVQNGGRRRKNANKGKPWERQHSGKDGGDNDDDDDDDTTTKKARLAIIFVSTCRRAALVSELFHNLGVDNVTLHSLLSQNRRLAALAKFQSHHVSVLIATDIASRGLDIPHVDLVVNAELPRRVEQYIHRVGRTARAGQRGRALSLVGEHDIQLVKAVEKSIQQELSACSDITDDMALKLLGPVTKATRLAKMKLMEIGFDELEQKIKKRKRQQRQERDQQRQA